VKTPEAIIAIAFRRPASGFLACGTFTTD